MHEPARGAPGKRVLVKGSASEGTAVTLPFWHIGSVTTGTNNSVVLASRESSSLKCLCSFIRSANVSSYVNVFSCHRWDCSGGASSKLGCCGQHHGDRVTRQAPTDPCTGTEAPATGIMGDGRSCLDDYALAGKLGTGTFGVVCFSVSRSAWSGSRSLRLLFSGKDGKWHTCRCTSLLLSRTHRRACPRP